MSTSNALRELAGMLDDIEASGLAVLDVSAPDEELLGDDALTATLTVNVPLLDGVDTDGIDVTPTNAAIVDGEVHVDLEVLVPFRAEPPEETGEGEQEAEAGGSPDAGGDDGGETADGEAGTDDAGDDELPPYKDPERLGDVYESHESFPKMRDALGVDVTAQTVRRHMIKHGIHDPDIPDDEEPDGSADPGANGENPGTESGAGRTVATDGIDLPDDVTLGAVKQTVKTARTLHEVQQRLGVERDHARRLLSELGLLEFVSGRLSEADRDVSDDEIDERIAASAPRLEAD